MGGGNSTGNPARGIDNYISKNKPKISRPYLLVIGNIPMGDYSIIEYKSLDNAKEREIKEKEESKLTKILKAIPNQEKDSKEEIFGYAIHKFEDGIQLQDLPLSIEDVFIGKKLDLCYKEAMKRKREKYLVKYRLDKFEDTYINFRPEEVIITPLYEVKEK